MKKVFKIGFVLITVIFLLLSGCSIEYGESYVDIVSVEVDPDDDPLIDGIEYDFTVEVEFNNTTLQKVYLDLWINNGEEEDPWTWIDGLLIEIFESGSFTFTFSEEAKHWDDGDDLVLGLGMYPPEPLFGDWTDLDWNTYILDTSAAR